MSFQRENRKRCSKKIADDSMAGEKATPNEVKEDIFSQEKGFRGFRKKPVVVLERCDITPSLKKNSIECKQNKHNKETVIAQNGIDNIGLHLEKLALQCSVMLAREDLEKLKSDVINKIRVVNSTKYGLNTGNNTLKEERNANNSIDVDKRSTQKRVSFSEQIIVHLVDDYVRCKNCKKMFVDDKRLRLHIRQSHGRLKSYVCHYCSKKFLDRTLFKGHIKLHCYVCGAFKSLNKHLKNKCSVCCDKKLYLCKTCDESYFKLMDLRDHSFGHIGTFFVCDICKGQFTNNCCLVHHIAFLHSEKCPEELYKYDSVSRLYLCNFCEYSSIQKDSIASHVANLPDLRNSLTTGYKDHYFCDVCLKRFDTEYVMLQHKRSHDNECNNSEVKNRLVNGNSSKEEEVTTLNLVDPHRNEVNPPVSNIIDLVADCNDADHDFTENINDENITKPDNKEDSNSIESIDYSNPPKKAIVDPVSKKTIISRFNCDICGKYYSSNYTLSRHKRRMHTKQNNQCQACEEVFEWPALLKSHNCLRANIPPMSANVYPRPGMYYDGLDEEALECDEEGDDFVMPAPIVELTEYDQFPQGYEHYKTVSNMMCVMPLQNPNYRLVVQEVPIEF